MDETFVRIRGVGSTYSGAVDSQGQTVDFHPPETRDRKAAKCFLERARWRILTIPRHTCLLGMGYEVILPAIGDLQEGGRLRRRLGAEPDATPTTGLSADLDQSNDGSAMQGPRPIPTARMLIQAIEAAHTIPKGQVLGIT